MLLDYLKYLCVGSILFMLLGAFYTYRANEKLAQDNPKKRRYPPGAILLAPFTWPLFILLSISLMVLRVVAYGLFLILFAIALVALRKPFFLTRLDKIFTGIGNKLLTANTFLIKLVFSDNPKNS